MPTTTFGTREEGREGERLKLLWSVWDGMRWDGMAWHLAPNDVVGRDRDRHCGKWKLSRVGERERVLPAMSFWNYFVSVYPTLPAVPCSCVLCSAPFIHRNNTPSEHLRRVISRHDRRPILLGWTLRDVTWFPGRSSCIGEDTILPLPLFPARSHFKCLLGR